MNIRVLFCISLCAMILFSCGQKGHFVGEPAKTVITTDEITNIPIGIKKGDTLAVCLREDISSGTKKWYLNTGNKAGDTLRGVGSDPYEVDVVRDTKLFVAE